MSLLKTIDESVSIGAGAIAGFRAPLFTDITKKPKQRKKATIKLKESGDIDPVTTSSLKELLRAKQKDSDLRDNTEVFALEDNDGCIVKVYVKADQADNFKSALESALSENEKEGREIAEILYNLHEDFDIISVDWGKGSIPEDEEVSSEDPIQNNSDAEEKGFPDNSELGDVEAEDQSDPNDVSDGDDQSSTDFDSLSDPAPTPTNDSVDQVKLLNQIVALLQSQADAQRAKAEAEKAQADVAASEAAAKSAAQYASYQEEVMDMENYNKHQQEQKRQSQIQAKLLRYRHDLRKDGNSSLDDKLNDPQYLLNTLQKASLGESMSTAMPQTNDPTPEEEEILRMEDWEKEQKESQQKKKLRDRLVRYKYHRNKSTESSKPTGAAQKDAEPHGEPKQGSLMDYLMRAQRANQGQE